MINTELWWCTVYSSWLIYSTLKYKQISTYHDRLTWPGKEVYCLKSAPYLCLLSKSLLSLLLSAQCCSVLSFEWWAKIRVSMRPTLKIFTELQYVHAHSVCWTHGRRIATHIHTYIHRYSDFLVWVISVGLASASPNEHNQSHLQSTVWGFVNFTQGIHVNPQQC